MIRWKYVVPRLLGIAAIVGVLCIALGPLTRLLLVFGGQAATGARVDVQHVEVDLLKSQVTVSGLNFADPNHEHQNLFEADRIELDIDTRSALRKKFVVHEGRLTGLHIQSARTESGALTDAAGGDSGSVFSAAKDRSEQWIDSTVDILEQDVWDELQTVQLSQELRQRWPLEYDRLRQRANRIETQGHQLKDAVERISERPLDNLQAIPQTLGRIDGLHAEIIDAEKDLQRLSTQIELDQNAMIQAKQHDEVFLREKLHLNALDAESLNEYLLGPVWAKRLRTTLAWIEYSRQITSSSSSEEIPVDERGINVIFPGHHASPDFLIRRLLLEGGGTANGNQFAFSGEMKHLTHQSQRHSAPTSLHLEATGALRLTADVTLDRRQTVPQDRFLIDIPAIDQSEQILGNPQKMAMRIAPGSVSIRADLRVEGDELDGQIVIEQADLRIEPSLGAEYARYLTGDRLGRLREIDRFQAHVFLVGSLRQPRWRLESNLGEQIAEAVNAAVRDELAARQQQLMDRGRQEADREIARLQNQFLRENRELLEALEIGDAQVDALRQQLQAGIDSPEEIIGRGRQLLDMFQ